jgi:hypothetical protein
MVNCRDTMGVYVLRNGKDQEIFLEYLSGLISQYPGFDRHGIESDDVNFVKF